jgi:predicted unusual protein kinase regulating ubiquinone biosynthesis (AarF/ABC1/UbiB family)
MIPPYFALILKAFSILEGIGLEADPDYAIINGCYPYLSKRLITDDRYGVIFASSIALLTKILTKIKDYFYGFLLYIHLTL